MDRIEKDTDVEGGSDLSVEEEELLDVFKAITLSRKKVDTDKLVKMLEMEGNEVKYEDENWGQSKISTAEV